MPSYVESPFRAGEVLTAERLNALETEVRRLANVRGGTGLAVRSGRGGLQIAAVRTNDRYLCKAVGDIPPRDGATAGAGQVDLCWIRPEDDVIETTGDRIDVKNPSDSEMSAGVGIASGLYCWAERDPFGVWLVAPLECGS